MAQLRDILSATRKLLQEETNRCYELKIQVKEMENKLSLIGEGVDMSMLLQSGMDLIHKVKLRKNLAVISERVRLEDILDKLFDDGVLHPEHMTELRNQQSNRIAMTKFLSNYLSGSLAYHSLRDALKDHYPSIVDVLDNTMVVKDDISVPSMSSKKAGSPSPIGVVSDDINTTRQTAEDLILLKSDSERQGDMTMRFATLKETHISDTVIAENLRERIDQLKAELVRQSRRRKERFEKMKTHLATDLNWYKLHKSDLSFFATKLNEHNAFTEIVKNEYEMTLTYVESYMEYVLSSLSPEKAHFAHIRGREAGDDEDLFAEDEDERVWYTL